MPRTESAGVQWCTLLVSTLGLFKLPSGAGLKQPGVLKFVCAWLLVHAQARPAPDALPTYRCSFHSVTHRLCASCTSDLHSTSKATSEATFKATFKATSEATFKTTSEATSEATFRTSHRPCSSRTHRTTPTCSPGATSAQRRRRAVHHYESNGADVSICYACEHR